MPDSAGLGYGPVTVFFEQVYGPVNTGDSLGQQNDCQVLKCPVWRRAGLAMSVDLYICPHISAQEPLQEYWWGLFCALCRWRLFQTLIFWYPEVSTTNMTEAQACDVGETLNIESWNYSRQQMFKKPEIFNVLIWKKKCKTTKWRLQ
jgi:hypothetical protein